MFILSMLGALGFGPQFVSIVQMLFEDASAILSLNNCQTKAIGLHRLVRQRYPLTPSLYVLATKAFIYLLDRHSSGGGIYGIALPNNQG